jgi:DNA-binding protein HU-beta
VAGTERYSRPRDSRDGLNQTSRPDPQRFAIANFGLASLQTIRKSGGHVARLMSKSELIQKIAEQQPNGMTRKDVKGVIESLAEIGYKELKKAGAFFVPGFAKFVVIKKPATKARKGINPFTKEPTLFKAKPARKIIKARPVKAAKDAIA